MQIVCYCTCLHEFSLGSGFLPLSRHAWRRTAAGYNRERGHEFCQKRLGQWLWQNVSWCFSLQTYIFFQHIYHAFISSIRIYKYIKTQRHVLRQGQIYWLIRLSVLVIQAADLSTLHANIRSHGTRAWEYNTIRLFQMFPLYLTPLPPKENSPRGEQKLVECSASGSSVRSLAAGSGDSVSDAWGAVYSPLTTCL